jgi:putative IMPACT (imprinted ancient) family translation regulator
VCFAWRIGAHQYEDRFSDDGEPNNSAGKPIFGQIIAADITNVLIAVVRYYGGTNLGVGGLITAYKTSAKEAISEGEIIQKHEEVTLIVRFDPKSTGEAMAKINRSKGNINNHSVDMIGHFIEFTIQKGNSENIIEDLKKTGNFDVQIKK